ncbi:glycosyltransferase [Patescibacteria group bacterium]
MKRKNKKILILVWNMDIGGVQKRVRDIVYYLNRHYPRHEVYLLVKKAYPTPLLRDIKKLKKINIRYFSKTPKKKYLLSIFWLINEYYKIKPQVALTFLNRLSVQLIFVRWLYFWHPVKIILNEGIFTSLYLKMYENLFWQILVKIFYPLANTIIVPTKAIKIDLIKNYKVKQKGIFVVPNWILSFPKVSKNKKFDLIYLGRLEREKNIFLLLELVKKLKNIKPNITCCILGKGSLEKKLKYQILRQGLKENVCFSGFKKNVGTFLSQSKILILPSLNEGMPNCVLEASSYKIPSIINNFSGALEIITHTKTGYIARNKKEFFKYTKQLIKYPSLRKRLGTNAYKVAKQKFGSNNLKRFTKLLMT